MSFVYGSKKQNSNLGNSQSIQNKLYSNTGKRSSVHSWPPHSWSSDPVAQYYGQLASCSSRVCHSLLANQSDPEHFVAECVSIIQSHLCPSQMSVWASKCLPPFFPGLAIASALVDISQQKPSDNKDKTSGVRNRKHLSTRQGTCVWMETTSVLCAGFLHKWLPLKLFCGLGFYRG